jgi:hypothetical protein
MPTDPLDPLKKIQAHLEALRRLQNAGSPIVPPTIDASGLRIRYQTTGGAPSVPAAPPLPPVPDPLADWLLADLPPRAFHDLVTETVSREKPKGYRPGHVPRAEGLKLLKRRYDKDGFFRNLVGGRWLLAHKKAEDALRLLKPEDVRRDPWPAVERFGFPTAVWLLLLGLGGVHRAAGVRILKEVSAKEGRLDEILAEASARAPDPEKMWGLPEVSHDEEIARVQAEVEQILAERDRWKSEAESEKARREEAEDGLRLAREEVRRVAQAGSAGGQALKALEGEAAELRARLESLRDAESALKRMEKQIRELEHDRAKLLAGNEAWEAEKKGFAAEREALLAAADEAATAARLLGGVTAPPPHGAAAGKTPYRGEVLLLVTPATAAPYFEAAKRLGLTLLVHDGRSRTPPLDHFLRQAWRVLVLGDAGDAASRAVRDAGRPWARLPLVPAEAFERLLSSKPDW